MDETPVYRIFGLGAAGVRIADAVIGRTGGRLSGVAFDTDRTELGQLKFCHGQVLVGQEFFRGNGSAGDSTSVRMQAERERTLFARELEGVSVAIVVAGLGGGTGSGALPVLLRLAEDRRIPVLAVVLTPHPMEGSARVRAASSALHELDVAGLESARILLSNEDLAPASLGLTVQDALARATDIAASAISLLWKMYALRGYINVSAGDVARMLRAGRGTVDFGRAAASGPRRFSEATEALWNQPGLGLARKSSGAKAALVCVLGGPDLRLQEAGDAVGYVSSLLPFDTPVRLATVVDPDAAGTLEIVVLLFRRWAEPGAEDDPASASAGGRFADTAATLEAGENLDIPTFLRRRIHIDVD